MSATPSDCPRYSPIQPSAPSPAPEQAVVLVGGRGSRLGGLTETTPKPLLPVGDRPFLDHLLGEIARHGIAEIVLLCGYRAEALRARYAGARINGARVRCLVEPQPLGTGGALAFARREGVLGPEVFVFNGDSLFDVNLHDLALGRAEAESAAVALRRVADTGRYGHVAMDGTRITGWAEKTGGGPVEINGGVYLLSTRALDRLPGGASSLERDLFPALAREGRLAGRIYDGFFIDIGVPEDLARAQRAVPRALRRPIAFLDRDGTLNRDHGYVHTPAAFDWVSGAREAVKLLNDAGYRVAVVTNQAGVARGYYSTGAVDALHAWMQGQLIAVGAHLDAIAYCPHHPEGVVSGYACPCRCRKPGPGQIEALLAAWPTDRSRCFLLGDRAGDLAAAAAAGVPGYLTDGRDLLADVRAALAAR